MSRRLLATVAAAALTAGLAACGEGESGTVTTPPPSIDTGQDDGASDAGGEEPSDAGGADDAGSGDGSAEAAPDIPAPDPADFPGMDEQTPEGAEQAFKYYWAVVLWGHQTGDSETLRGLYTPECTGCEGIASDIDDIAAQGTYWVDGENVTVETRADDSLEGFDMGVIYKFELTEHTEPASENGGVVSAEEWTAIGALNWVDGQWVVEDLSSSPSDESAEG